MATTLAQLRTRVRNRADMPDSDGLVSDSELDTYINDSYAELMDLISQKNEDAYTSVDIVTSASPIPYASIATTGWAKIRRIDYFDGTDYHNLERIGIEEWPRYVNSTGTTPRAYTALGTNVYILPTPSGSKQYLVFYIKNPVALTSASDEVVAPPIVFRWEEYVVIDAAIKCLRKEESDTSELLQEKASMQSRISTSLSDRGGPARVAEVRRYASSYELNDWNWE